MAEVGSAFVSLMPSAKGFGSSAQRQIGPQMNSVAKSTGSRFGKVFAYSSMSPLKAIGAAAFGLFAIRKVKDFFSGAIDEARESQKVSALTASVIKSTGGAAGISAGQVGKLANSISLLTGIDDEAIQGAENLLLTFTNLRNEAGKGNDVFNQATKIVTDMSTALDQDLKSSSIQVGKALNDPVKGITALSRVGVSFTEQQKKQIETLVKSGNTLGAQKVILGELNKEFGGAAAAAATSGDKFHTAFANLQEQIGLALLPYLDKLLDKGTVLIGWLMTQVPAGLQAFKSALGPVTDAIGNLVSGHLEAFHTILAALSGGVLASVIALIGGGLVAVLATLASFLASPVVLIGALAGAAIYAYVKFESFRNLVQQVIAWFQTSFIPALMATVAAVTAFALEFYARIQPMLPQVQQIFGQIVSVVKSYLTLAAAEVKIAVAVIQYVWSHFNGQMLDYAVRTFGNIITAVKGGLNIVQGLIRLVTALIKGDWSGAWNAIKQITKGVLQVVVALVRQSLAQWQAIFGVAKQVLPALASKAWDLVKAAFVAGVKLSVKAAAKLPELVTQALAGLYKIGVHAAEQLVEGLISVLKNAPSKVGDAVKGIASSIKDHFPGSPVKTGPLTSWNNGGAGKRLMGLLADGITAASPKVLKAMQNTVEKLIDQATTLRDGIKSKLDAVKSDFASLKDSITSAFAGGLFDVSAIAPGLTDTVFTAGATVGQAFLDGLRNKKTELKDLLKAFKTLKHWGLSSQFLSQLFASGNTDLILELAGGSRSNAVGTAGLFGDVQSLSNQLGSQVARNQYGKQIQGLDDKLAKANEHLKHLDHLAKDLGHEINQAAAAAARRHRKAS